MPKLIVTLAIGAVSKTIFVVELTGFILLAKISK